MLLSPWQPNENKHVIKKHPAEQTRSIGSRHRTCLQSIPRHVQKFTSNFDRFFFSSSLFLFLLHFSSRIRLIRGSNIRFVYESEYFRTRLRRVLGKWRSMRVRYVMFSKTRDKSKWEIWEFCFRGWSVIGKRIPN